MRLGVFSDIPNHEYHSGEGISKSGLDLIARSPLHYRHVLEAANDHAPTPAQLIGTALHSLVLEPHLFVKEYTLALRQSDVPEAVADRDQLVAMVEELNAGRLAKLPTSGSKAELVARIVAAEAEQWPGQGKPAADLEALSASELKEYVNHLNASRPGKLSTSGAMADLARLLRDAGRPITLWSDVKDEWLANNGHRTVLTPETWDQVHRMRDSIMAHPAARALLEVPGRAEHSVYWIDPSSGEQCRCRPDYWRDDNILVDLKTTEDASPEGFARSVADWRYHVQDPFYRDGIEIATGKKPRAFVFLVVEKKAPYAVAVYSLTAESVELGRQQYQADLQRYAECRRTGVWPGYGDRIQPIGLPAWFISRAAERAGAA